MDDYEFRTIEVPMSMFTDLDLVALNKAAEQYFDAGIIALAFLVGQLAEHEGARKMWNRANPDNQRPAGHIKIRPKDWSDRDVADAMVACWGLAEHTRNAKAGELFDSLGDAFVEIAADRLRDSGDPRNDVTFTERNKQKESPHDPSSN